MCNWIHVSLGVVASLIGLLFLFHERDAATADSHLQDCEPPIHFTAAFSEEICSHPKEGYTVWRTGKDIICHCTDRRLQCPGTQFYVDDKDKKVFHVIFNEAYAVQSVLEAELGICHYEKKDIVSTESSQQYSEVTTPVSPRECSTVSESDNYVVRDVLIGVVVFAVLCAAALVAFIIMQRKKITRLRQEKHGMNAVIQGLTKENQQLRMHTCPVRQAGDGGDGRQRTDVGVKTTGNDQAVAIDMDNGERDNTSAGHNTNGQAAVPNVDQNSLPSSLPSNQQPNRLPSPSDVSHLPSPNDVSHLPSPNDVSHLLSPNDVSHLPSPNDVSHLPSPNDVSHLPSPNDVRVHSLPGVQPSNVVTLVNMDDNQAMGVHSTPSDFHSPPDGDHATPQPSERPFSSSDTFTYQDVDANQQTETAPLIDGDDSVKQRNEHENKAQERQS